VAVVEKTTTDVFTAKVALLVPARTVTLAGTVAAALSLDRETTTPSPGAGPLSVTVPVDEPSGPPTTLAGISVSEERLGGKTVSEAVRVPPLYKAEIVTDVDTVTARVLTAKVALVEPAGTVTLAGGVAAASLLDNVTVAPPAGAGKLSVTVPVGAEVPPVTLAGVRLSEERLAGVSLIRIATASGNAPYA
jgi:hypothetical protein